MRHTEIHHAVAGCNNPDDHGASCDGTEVSLENELHAAQEREKKLQYDLRIAKNMAEKSAGGVEASKGWKANMFIGEISLWD